MSYEEKIKIYQKMIRNLEIELKHYEGTPYFEDEEFKIKERINMHKEEIRLYNQAAKADEYEAKAKAWDRVYEAFEKAKNEHEFSNGVCTIMNEYESGEPDAKK